MEYIEITLYNDDNINVEAIVKELQKLGLRYKQVRRLKEEDFKEKFSPIIQQGKRDEKKECCGGDKKDKPLPSLPKRAINYAKAQAQWLKDGMPLVVKEKFLYRLAICAECDELNNDWKCSKCGCPMKEKAVRDMKNLCELEKW